MNDYVEHRTAIKIAPETSGHRALFGWLDPEKLEAPPELWEVPIIGWEVLIVQRSDDELRSLSPPVRGWQRDDRRHTAEWNPIGVDRRDGWAGRLENQDAFVCILGPCETANSESAQAHVEDWARSERRRLRRLREKRAEKAGGAHA